MIYSGYFCDKCGNSVVFSKTTDEWIPSKTHLVRIARKNGWSIGKRVLCPKCRNTEVKKEVWK